MLTMGARRSFAAALPSTTAAAVPHSKKNKSNTGAAPSGLSGSAADTAASAAGAVSPRAAIQVADAVEKREGKKKRAKQGSCTEQSSDELSSSRAADIRNDSGSTSERCGVQLGRKKMKQRLSACNRDDPDHITPAVAAGVATQAAPASKDVASEREKKRRKKYSNAAVEARGVSSTSNNVGSSSEGTSNCRGSSSHRAFGSSTNVCSSSTSVCSDISDSSDSSSTCCSSPSASLENPPSAAAAKREKRRESVKEEGSRVSGKEEEQEENEESCGLGVTAAASATQGEQQQGSQLSAYNLTAQTLAVLQQRGIQQLLPIQAATFSSVFSGKDLIGRADTGTGKTLAFALPLIERLLSSSVSSSSRSTSTKNSSISGGRNEARGVRLLVLLPTRELAQQVHAEFVLLLQGRMETACVYGGGGAAAAGRQQQYRWQSGKQAQPGGVMNGLLQQQQQLENLRRGRCGILVGCPGRVKDLINRGYLQRGAALQSVVLDEADRLLDMGFREDVEEILQWCRDAWKQADVAPAVSAAEQKNNERGERSTNVFIATESGNSNKSSKEALQFLLFTATLPHWARSLASRFMRPDRLLVDAATLNNGTNANSAFNKTNEKRATTGGSSEQQQQQSGTNQGITYMVLFCPWKNRVRVLEDVLTVYAGCPGSRLSASTIPLSFSTVSSTGDSLDWAAAAAGESTAVTAGDGGDASVGGRRTGAAAVIFAETKQQVNEIAFESGLRRLAAPLHGDLPQQQRETTLHAFKSGCFPYLVATDVAARGLHVDGLPLVVQLSPPRDLDSFVHRAGRTGRAGKAGICLTFAAAPDIPMLLTLEKKLRMQFKRVGVPQPAGIQRRLLELQLRWLLPATAATEESCNSSSRPSRTDISATSSCSSNDSSSKSNSERGRKRLRQGDCGDAQGSLERSEKKENEMEKDAGGKVERVGADKEKTECTEEGHGKIKEETRQILEAADRVLHALSPREAVRRCLALLLRHAAAGTTYGTVFPQNEPVAGEACSSTASAAAGAEGLQTVPPGMERLSCLNGREGLCTYVLRKREQQHELQQQHQQNGGGLLRTPGEVWRLLKGALLYQRRRISEGREYSERSSVPDQMVEELLERIHSLTLTADGRGAVFDVAAADIPAFEAHILRRCGEQQPPEEKACCCHSTEATGKRKRDRSAASDGERGRGKREEEIERTDDAGEAAAQAPEIPFVIRVAEELPELVDALALRRSERAQGGSRSSMHQERSSDFRSPWKSGSRDNSERNRGGGYHHSSNGNNNRTWGSANRFRSEKGYSSSNSERGMQQRSWTPRGRGGGGGRVGISRGRRGVVSNRGRGGYHHRGK